MGVRLQIQDGFRSRLYSLGTRGGQLAEIGYVTIPLDFNYITMAENAMVEYMPMSRMPAYAWHAWYEKGRQQMKFGRMLRAVRDAVKSGEIEPVVEESWGWRSRRDGEYDPRKLATLTDNEITEMVNRLRDMSKPADYRIVTGDDIITWYHHTKMVEDEEYGNLYSCMVHGWMGDEYRKPPVAAYAMEPNCGLAISTKTVGDDERLLARCLVWTATDGKRYYDKQYGAEHRSAGLRRWLESQDILYVGDVDVAVAMKQNWRMIARPYLDTMDVSSDGKHLYAGDGAGFGTYATCDECGDDIEDEDSAYTTDWGSTVCGDCYHAHTCSRCDGWGDPDEMRWHSDFGLVCETCQEGLFCQECHFALTHRQRRMALTFCDDCWELICNDCGEYSPYTECGFCPDCLRDHTCRRCGAVEMDTVSEGRCDFCEAETEEENDGPRWEDIQADRFDAKFGV